MHTKSGTVKHTSSDLTMAELPDVIKNVGEIAAALMLVIKKLRSRKKKAKMPKRGLNELCEQVDALSKDLDEITDVLGSIVEVQAESLKTLTEAVKAHIGETSKLATIVMPAVKHTGRFADILARHEKRIKALESPVKES